MRDLHNNISPVVALPAQSVTATTSGSTVDLQGYESCEFVISWGAFTYETSGAALAVTVQDSDNGTAWTNVASTDLLGTAPTQASDVAAAGAVSKVGYIGDKRYVRLVFTETETVVAPVSAIAIRSNARHKPSA